MIMIDRSTYSQGDIVTMIETGDSAVYDSIFITPLVINNK